MIARVPTWSPPVAELALGRTVAAQLVVLDRLGARDGGLDAEGVHDLRVATRRLREALRLLGGRALAGARRRARALQDALGAVRDVHVQLEWLASAGGRGAARLAALQRARLARRQRRLAEAIEAWARAAPGVLPRVAALEARRSPGRVLDLVGATARALERALARLERGLDPDRAHRARIQAKRLRYQLEVVGPRLGALADEALERLAALQRALGDLHDVDVRLALLARRPGAGRLERRAARSRRALGRAVEHERRRVARADLLRRLREALARSAA